jgi:protein CpxP
MKKLMITATLLISIVSFGYSQSASEGSRPQRNRIENRESQHALRTPEERAKMRADALAKRLNLSADQKAKVYDLNLERAREIEKLRNSQNASKKDQMEKFRAFNEETEQKLNSILTVEQQKSYQQIKNEARDRMQQRRGAETGSRGNKVK